MLPGTWFLLSGRGREITPGFLPSALRAALRAFKFAPGEFVELPRSHPYPEINFETPTARVFQNWSG